MQETFTDGDFDATFGANVAEYRKTLKWSQRRLAEEMESHGVKLDPSAITRIERGGREAKLREAVAMAAAMRVDLRVLTRLAKRDPQAELESLLDSTVERRHAARWALVGMSTYYVMAIRLMEEHPKVLEDMRNAVGWDRGLGVIGFLRREAEILREQALPVGSISATEEQNALIQDIVTAAVANLTTPSTDEDESGAEA